MSLRQVKASIEGKRYIIAELPEGVTSIVAYENAPAFALYVKGQEDPVELALSEDILNRMHKPVKCQLVAQLSKITPKQIEDLKLIAKEPYFREFLQYHEADTFKDGIIVRTMDYQDDEYSELQ